MSAESFDELFQEILQSVSAGGALRENAIRRKIAQEFEMARLAKGLSIRQLAAKMNTSVSQVQRLTHQERGGSLTLKTICRAAQVLDLKINIHVRPQSAYVAGKVCSFGSSAPWQTEPTNVQPSAVQPAVNAPQSVSASARASEWTRLSKAPSRSAEQAC